MLRQSGATENMKRSAELQQRRAQLLNATTGSFATAQGMNQGQNWALALDANFVVLVSGDSVARVAELADALDSGSSR